MNNFNENEELDRVFNIKESGKTFTKETIRIFLKNTNKNILMIAQGGMGKTYFSKKISEYSNKKIFKSQEIKRNDICSNIIIDNLDEVPLEKAQEIITWVTTSKSEGVIIFSRPETISYQIDSLIKIEFKTVQDINPRFLFDFKIKGKNKLYQKMENFFLSESKINEFEFDFLSILSFKVLIEGKIHMNKYDLFEFTRKYNFNNSTHISIQDLIEKDVLTNKFNDERVYFKSKTIPSFFVICFIKRFAHIKNSFISYFNNFGAQISFKETAQIINMMDDEKLDLKWRLIQNNLFFFMFISVQEWSDELTEILTYGSERVTKNKFTKLISRLQIMCSNDIHYDGTLIFYDSKKIMESIEPEEYISNLQSGILNKTKAKKAVYSYINTLKLLAIKEKKFFTQLKSIVKKIKWEEFQGEYPTGERWCKVIEYIFNKTSINNIKIEEYSNYAGPIETATHFLMIYNKNKALEILKYFKFTKYSTYEKDVLWNFIEWMLHNEEFESLTLFLLTQGLDHKTNEKIILKVGPQKFSGYLKKIHDNYQRDIEKIYKKYDNYAIQISSEFFEEYFDWKYYQLFEEVEMKEWIQLRDSQIEQTVLIPFTELKERVLSFNNSNIKELFNKYDNKPLKRIVELKVEGEVSEGFIKQILEKIKKIFSESTNFHKIIKNTEPILQILFKLGWEPDVKEISPFLLVYIPYIKLNQSQFSNKFEEEESWYSELNETMINQKVISYFKKKENFAKMATFKNQYALNKIITPLLREIDFPEKEEFITLLPHTNDSLFWNVYNEYFYNSKKSKERSKQLEWIPLNLYQYYQFKDKTELLFKNEKVDVEFFKKLVCEMLKSDFSFLKENINKVQTVEWYDNFFETWRSKSVYVSLVNDLIKFGLIEWYFSLLKERVYKEIQKGNLQLVVPLFIENLISFSYISGEQHIQKKMEINELMEEVATENEKRFIKKIWLIKTGEILNPKFKNKQFQIDDFYRYLNDDQTLEEFNQQFKMEIFPLIEEIAKNQYKVSKRSFETEVHEKITKDLPEMLFRKYSILYQPESNAFNPEENSRIDFILSKMNKYLFLELKSSTDSRLSGKKLTEQLFKYQNKYRLRCINTLIIFNINKMGSIKRRRILKKAWASNFEVLFVELYEEQN
ncbi:hypothetical protein [Mycoplasma todarodis]|uniref:hypothetical protein n=1 Tax=Mycoplasma todarodis TaxID=1937191 RepID=UPI003B5042EC